MPRFYDPDTGKELVYTFDTADNILKANKLKDELYFMTGPSTGNPGDLYQLGLE